MKTSPRIAIIGAGISGLSCVTALQNSGYEVTVFEKSKGVSGRISTRVREAWQCDHGAQYFTASDAQFAVEVKRWQQAGVAAEWQPRLQVFDGVRFIAKESTKVRYVGVPRNTAPAKFLAQSLNVKVATTINKIERHHGVWQLSSKEHGKLMQPFDALILAIPSPQAQALLQQPAPKLAGVAAGVKMRGCWALMCRFNAALSLPFDGLFVNNNLLSWVARDSAKPQRNQQEETWVLHASSEWSEAHIEDDAETVAALMLAAFVKLGGEMPQSYTAHRWRYADCVDYLEIGCAWDADLQLGLCGDWLNGGKVQGAWLSGHLLANQLLTT
ncbi:MAG: FAD-dependent oxidoreductase [Bdellovibrio sp.]|nr:FAD-dependent oxidoreductase [Methylotenera sp.]